MIRCLYLTDFTLSNVVVGEIFGHNRWTQGVHSSSTVNIHVRAQKGYYLKQACTKCTYKRHIAIKQEVDIHEAGDKAIEKYM
jgi:hypothetical protein